jgi:hypothetical protein
MIESKRISVQLQRIGKKNRRVFKSKEAVQYVELKFRHDFRQSEKHNFFVDKLYRYNEYGKREQLCRNPPFFLPSPKRSIAPLTNGSKTVQYRIHKIRICFFVYEYKITLSKCCIYTHGNENYYFLQL